MTCLELKGVSKRYDGAVQVEHNRTDTAGVC